MSEIWQKLNVLKYLRHCTCAPCSKLCQLWKWNHFKVRCLAGQMCGLCLLHIPDNTGQKTQPHGGPPCTHFPSAFQPAQKGCNHTSVNHIFHYWYFITPWNCITKEVIHAWRQPLPVHPVKFFTFFFPHFPGNSLNRSQSWLNFTLLQLYTVGSKTFEGYHIGSKQHGKKHRKLIFECFESLTASKFPNY